MTSPRPDTRYDDTLSMRQARDAYFARNGFDADGGYGKRWERMKLGPLAFYVPNGDSRVRALRMHDLHHVLTGYATDWQGELEIAAWELASGCRDHGFAWLINLGGLAAGLLRWPGPVLRAFVRGRRSGNLYGATYDSALLSAPVAQVRRQLGLDAAAAAAGPSDVLACAGLAAAGAVVGLGWLLFLPLVLPYAAVTATLRRRDADRALAESP